MTKPLHRQAAMKPCPGPNRGGEDTCLFSGTFEARSNRTERCHRCAYRREVIRAKEEQRVKRSKKRTPELKLRLAEELKAHTRARKAGHILQCSATLSQPPRTAIIRCKTCLGDSTIREQGREDEMGVPVCLPGMARCWRCWEAYAPDAPLRAMPVLASSAGMAARIGGLW